MEMQANFRPDLLGNIEPFEVDKLLYRLVTVFKSSREIALSAAENDGFMQKLKERFEISEAMTVISLLAVTMRNSLDNGLHSAQFKIQVGHLFQTAASEVAKPLFFGRPATR